MSPDSSGLHLLSLWSERQSSLAGCSRRSLRAASPEADSWMTSWCCAHAALKFHHRVQSHG